MAKRVIRVLKVGGLFIPTIEGPGAIDLVSKDCDVSSDFIQKELNESGIFYKNYSWVRKIYKKEALQFMNPWIYHLTFPMNMAIL